MGKHLSNAKIRSMAGCYEEARINQERKLKKLSERPKVSQKELSEKDMMMAKASDFVENGIPFEMAPVELQQHHFFKIGYEVAVRRQKALNNLNKGISR